ncbi:type II toxin-antitoxin system VapC family toxin [Macrococcus capreoli]|uniref:type II toxin-antitoxin system VapC family toxin n=1 Tax=Macrococcus capreoli TaxID=2982690 RepID=UPI003EE6E20B
MTNNSVFISTRFPVNSKLIDKDIYMDTNTIMNLYDNRNNHTTNNIKRFISEVNANNSVLYYSQHVLDEMTTVLHKNYQNQFKSLNQLNNTKEISKDEGKQIFSQVYNEVKNFESDILSKISNKITFETEEVDKMKIQLSLNTGMVVPDSKHIAIAKTNGIHSILTDDKDFLAAENLNIYGSTKAIHDAFLSNPPTTYLKFD